MKKIDNIEAAQNENWFLEKVGGEKIDTPWSWARTVLRPTRPDPHRSHPIPKKISVIWQKDRRPSQDYWNDKRNFFCQNFGIEKKTQDQNQSVP